MSGWILEVPHFGNPGYVARFRDIVRSHIHGAGFNAPIELKAKEGHMIVHGDIPEKLIATIVNKSGFSLKYSKLGSEKTQEPSPAPEKKNGNCNGKEVELIRSLSQDNLKLTINVKELEGQNTGLMEEAHRWKTEYKGLEERFTKLSKEKIELSHPKTLPSVNYDRKGLGDLLVSALRNEEVNSTEAILTIIRDIAQEQNIEERELPEILGTHTKNLEEDVEYKKLKSQYTQALEDLEQARELMKKRSFLKIDVSEAEKVVSKVDEIKRKYDSRENLLVKIKEYVSEAKIKCFYDMQENDKEFLIDLVLSLNYDYSSLLEKMMNESILTALASIENKDREFGSINRQGLLTYRLKLPKTKYSSKDAFQLQQKIYSVLADTEAIIGTGVELEVAALFFPYKGEETRRSKIQEIRSAIPSSKVETPKREYYSSKDVMRMLEINPAELNRLKSAEEIRCIANNRFDKLSIDLYLSKRKLKN